MIGSIKLMRIEPCFRALKPVYGENSHNIITGKITEPQRISQNTINISTVSDTFTSSEKEQNKPLVKPQTNEIPKISDVEHKKK